MPGGVLLPPAYGLSKAFLHKYTEVLARDNPHLKIIAATPGFSDTNLTKGMGAERTADEGAKSILHCMFSNLEENGWYYGPDGLRNPLHKLRNAGDPAFTGYK